MSRADPFCGVWGHAEGLGQVYCNLPFNHDDGHRYVGWTKEWPLSSGPQGGRDQ